MENIKMGTDVLYGEQAGEKQTVIIDGFAVDHSFFPMTSDERVGEVVSVWVKQDVKRGQTEKQHTIMLTLTPEFAERFGQELILRAAMARKHAEQVRKAHRKEVADALLKAEAS